MFITYGSASASVNGNAPRLIVREKQMAHKALYQNCELFFFSSHELA